MLEEVAALVDALDVDIARRVKLRVHRLSASLLDTIARALPLLRKLEITFVDIGAMEESRHGAVSDRLSSSIGAAGLTSFTGRFL